MSHAVEKERGSFYDYEAVRQRNEVQSSKEELKAEELQKSYEKEALETEKLVKDVFSTQNEKT